MPLKVLQITRSFDPCIGGVERFVQDLSRQLLEHEIRSDVLTLNRCFYSDKILPETGFVDGIRVHRIPFRGSRRFFLAPGALALVDDYDLLHIHNIDFFFNLLTLLQWYHHRPVVLSTHGGFFHTRELLLVKRAYFSLLARALLPRAQAVIADSAHDLALFGPISQNVIQIDNGVDFSRFGDTQKDVEPGLMLYVGRLSHNKRVDNLIKVFRHVNIGYAQARLVLVGCDFDGIAGELMALAAAHGVENAVTFAGELPDSTLKGHFERAHVFVSASEYEGFGISTVEAMSAATVPIVNAIPPFRDLIEEGLTGFLTDFADSKQAANVILSALRMSDNTLHQMGNRAREAARNYAWENVITRYIDVYDRVSR